MEYKSYTSRNYRHIKQISQLSEQELFDIDLVAKVLPFKTNNYVVDELIDWKNYKTNPLFILNFPQKNMLSEEHYETMARLIRNDATKTTISRAAHEIRFELNPHPAGQMEYNVPEFDGEKLIGIQHKYKETLLFFPTQGQTCHAFCTFCFRWPQFTALEEMKFAMNQTDLLVKYLKRHPYVSDVLITGGDPMIMSTSVIAGYINALLEADLPHLENIRIGTKSLTYWPYRYLTDPDAEGILQLFRKVSDSGIHLAFMAHVSHPDELKTSTVQEAIGKIRMTGAQIRTQSPLLKNINNHPDIWSEMWKKQVSLGMVPYYMFVARDTGAKNYFALPLAEAWKIFRVAYSQVSGIARTVRGPSMSANPGKVQILGVMKVKGEKVFILNFLQARNPEWVGRPFLAAYDENADWLTDLKPAFGEKEFFYSDEFRKMLKINEDSMGIYSHELENYFRDCNERFKDSY